MKAEQSNSRSPGWKALLIGGCSGVGKTTAASEMARHFSASLSQVDDSRMALQSATTPAQQPDLHFFISSPGVAKTGVWQMSPAVLCDALVKVGEVMSRALEVVVAHHVATDNPLLLEGDGILPAFAAQQVSERPTHVRAVFLFEPDPTLFFERASMHEPAEARMHWLYGLRLVNEAARLGLPTVPARPWETLADRILCAIGET